MIKFTGKSYLLSLKYIWLPILIFLICLIPASVYFIVSSKSALNDLQSSLTGEIGSIGFSIEGLIDFVFDSAKALPWKTPAKALNMIFNEDWFSSVLEEFLAETEGNAYTAAMQGNVKNTAAAIQSNFSLFPVSIIVGLVLSYFITSSFLRKKLCPRSIWKTILTVLIDLVLTSTLVAGAAYLMGLWIASVFITSVLTAVLYGFISLFEAYIIHKDGKMKIRDVINVKVVLQLLASYLLILALAIVIIVLLFLIPIKLISVILALPIIIITFIEYNLTAESYVVSLRKDYKEKL